MKKIAFIILVITACQNSHDIKQRKYNCERNKGQVFQIDSLEFYKNCAEELILKDDTIFNIPSSLQESKKLTEVKFENCYFIDLKSSLLSLSKASSIKKLTLDLRVANNIPEEIGLLQNIDHLSITIDSAKFLPPDFYTLKNLKSLYLFSKDFNFNSDWINFKGLRELGISAKLTTIPDFVFECDSLQKLDLSNNSIESIPDKISKLSTLKELNIVNNPIILEDKEWHDLKKLKALKKKCNGCKIISNVSTFE